MTMLDRMRRHRNWLKFSLGGVVVAFIVLYIPSFLKPGGTGAGATDVIATIDGREISVGEYQRIYQAQVQQLRQAYGGNLDEQMIKQLALGQRIIAQLLDQESVIAEAKRLKVTVTDAELRERLLRWPGFQENGQFIGYTRYAQFLRMQRPPMTEGEFEDQLRDALLTEKLQAAITGWVTVSDAEVDQEYKKRNEKVKLDLAIFTADKFKSAVQPTDAELSAQFEAHKEQYRIPEKRHVRYLAVDGQSFRTKVTVTPQEVEQQYKDTQSTYSTPEQVRASHILLKTGDGKDDAAVKAKAEALLKQAKAPGADFAALAKKNSEDEASAKNGGDVDFFGRGTMAKEFEDSAFSMKVGEISDLVKTTYGYHIIKLTAHNAATSKTLEEVRPQIDEQIRTAKAQTEAASAAEAIAKEIKEPADLDKVARERNLTVGDSGLFARDEPLAGLGFAPEVANEAFTMQQGKASGLLRTNQGFAFISLVEIKPSYVPALAEVKDKVKDDVARLKAVDVARQKADTMAQAAKGNFAAAAKAAGVEIKSTEFITRGSALPEVGTNQAVDDAVFALKAGDTTAPIATDNAVVVARVKERQDIDASKASTERDTLRGQMLNERRGQFFAAYMSKAKAKMSISYNENTIRALLERQ